MGSAFLSWSPVTLTQLIWLVFAFAIAVTVIDIVVARTQTAKQRLGNTRRE